VLKVRKLAEHVIYYGSLVYLIVESSKIDESTIRRRGVRRPLHVYHFYRACKIQVEQAEVIVGELLDLVQ
jgi:hypothetical protein